MIALRKLAVLMTVLNSEQVISRIDTGHGELVLTNRRVAHRWQSKFSSIKLEDVGLARVARPRHRWMRVVTGTCVAMAAFLVEMVIQGRDFEPVDIYHSATSALLFLTAFLVVVFGVKHLTMVQISSREVIIAFRIRKAVRRDINRFLLDLDKARIGRYFAYKSVHGNQKRKASSPSHRAARRWQGLRQRLKSVLAGPPLRAILNN